MGKWAEWYYSLDERTRQWVDKQPIYTSKEMNWTMFWTFVAGLLVGLAF